MRLLDFGCGPGTISVGLAEAVRPGRLHGIDMEASQIETAQAAALAGGHANMELRTGDVTEMPFDDASFDVARCHAVLTHIPDTQGVLAEVRRVLKPGGLLACRELINASCFFEPGADSLNSDWETFRDLRAANGGHPQMGRQRRASPICGPTRSSSILARRRMSPFPTVSPPAGSVRKKRWKRPSDSAWPNARRLMPGVRRWRAEPGAVAAIGWGHALGRKP